MLQRTFILHSFWPQAIGTDLGKLGDGGKRFDWSGYLEASLSGRQPRLNRIECLNSRKTEPTRTTSFGDAVLHRWHYSYVNRR